MQLQLSLVGGGGGNNGSFGPAAAGCCCGCVQWCELWSEHPAFARSVHRPCPDVDLPLSLSLARALSSQTSDARAHAHTTGGARLCAQVDVCVSRYLLCAATCLPTRLPPYPPHWPLVSISVCVPRLLRPRVQLPLAKAVVNHPIHLRRCHADSKAWPRAIPQFPTHRQVQRLLKQSRRMIRVRVRLLSATQRPTTLRHLLRARSQNTPRHAHVELAGASCAATAMRPYPSRRTSHRRTLPI